MEMQPAQAGQKHIRSFWPLVTILVVATILGGVIYWFQFQLITDYDLQSFEIKIHKRNASKGTKVAPKTTPVSPAPTPAK